MTMKKRSSSDAEDAAKTVQLHERATYSAPWKRLYVTRSCVSTAQLWKCRRAMQQASAARMLTLQPKEGATFCVAQSDDVREVGSVDQHERTVERRYSSPLAELRRRSRKVTEAFHSCAGQVKSCTSKVLASFCRASGLPIEGCARSGVAYDMLKIASTDPVRAPFFGGNLADFRGSARKCRHCPT